MKYIIGIDIGTSATKAVAMDISGAMLATVHVTYAPVLSQPGYHELDPGVLVDAVISALSNIIEKTKHQAGLSGISFSCAMHSLIAINKNGAPITHVITWADTRSKTIAEQLRQKEQGIRIYEHTGTPVHAMSPLCKIIWMKEQAAGVFAKTFKFIGIKEYVWLLLFGEFVIDHSLASATGLFDVRKREWYDEALAVAGITDAQLSRPVPVTYSNTALQDDFRKRIGLEAVIPFIVGGSDGCLANLGTYAVEPGDAALTIGTSGALRMASDMPCHDLKQRLFNYILTDHIYISGGAVNNGGVVVEWFIKNFMQGYEGLTDFTSLMKDADTIAPGSDGLIFLPYLLGERAPIWDADARGVFFGISPAHTRPHFLRAVIEGISFSLYQVGVSLQETIGPIRHIYASGGFIQSSAWLQLIADLFNCKVFVTANEDASATGAAMIGFLSTGLIGDISSFKKLTKILHVFEPDHDRHQVYAARYSVFTRLYKLLKDEFRLAASNPPV